MINAAMNFVPFQCCSAILLSYACFLKVAEEMDDYLDCTAMRCQDTSFWRRLLPMDEWSTSLLPPGWPSDSSEFPSERMDVVGTGNTI